MDIIFFDGKCNLCNAAVNFVIDRDPKGHFKLAPLQSEKAATYLSNEKIKKIDSVVLYSEGVIYEQSTAALQIARKLSRGWSLLYVFIIIPGPVRDFFYNIIAKNRYKWFGKQDTCRVATPELKDRFL